MSGPLLFVYGSLRSDLGQLRPPKSAGAFAWLAANAVLEGPGRVSGRLFTPAWYPGLVPGPAGMVAGHVRGEVWRLGSEAALAPLDEFEGDAYAREAVTAELFDGRRVTAYAYRYIADLTGVSQIASGDYLGWVRNRP